jgi:hypothetical protein
MSVDERRRLELADAAKRTLGDDAGITLMELLPPVGWADVATKQDLLALRGDLRAEIKDLRDEFTVFKKDIELQIERQFRGVVVTMMSLMIGGFFVTILAIVASAFLS